MTEIAVNTIQTIKQPVPNTRERAGHMHLFQANAGHQTSHLPCSLAPFMEF